MSSAARPPFERAATPPVAQSRVAGKVESSPLQIPTIARIDGKTVWFKVASTFNQLLHLHGESENVCFIGF